MSSPSLPSRYQIRVLGPEHVQWASAIFLHTNLFNSPAWPVIYTNGQAARLHEIMAHVDYLIRHQVESGLSLGVFDSEYRFRRPESAAVGGRLYWDAADGEVGGEALQEQMDFPLVSIALAYDAADALDWDRMAGLVRAWPLVAPLYAELERRDARPRAEWAADGRGQLLLRNGTNTRGDYQGLGLMKTTARHMMRTAADAGFRGIQIETMADAVEHVWSKPPPPFEGRVVSAFDTMTYEEEGEGGAKVYPFRPADQRVTKIYCSLVARR